MATTSTTHYNRGSPALAITGLGMVSALGPGVVVSCAAARAGISRARAIEGTEAWDPEDCEMEPIIGHEISLLTRGFTGLGRLVRLGEAALHDLCRHTDTASWGRVGVLINVASGFHFSASFDSATGEGGASATLKTRVKGEIEERRAQIDSRLIPTLLAGASFQPSVSRIVFGDEAGFVAALEEARLLLDAGRIDVCLVGGIESQTEFETLRVLQTLGLLKDPDTPTGRIPGESASFVLIESIRSAQRRRINPMASLLWSELVREPAHRFSSSVATGSALMASIAGVLKRLPPGAGNPGLVIADLNGEEFRARDWGCARIQLRANRLLNDMPEWYPALHFGTIGAATGAVAVCMACRAFARNYAGTDTVLAWLHSDDGSRASLCIKGA